jgi:hypothetical protein
MLPGLPALVLVLARGALRFLGDTGCPENSAVQAEIARLNPGLAQTGANHLALLSLREEGLEIRLFDEDGNVLEERLIRGSKSCAAWAKTTAVVLVTWETEPAAPVLALPSFPNPPPPPQAPSAAVHETVAASEPHPRWRGEIGAGFIGSVASDGLAAPGVELRASLEPANGRFGGQLTLLATAPRNVPLGPGSASWERFAAGLGGHLNLGPPKLRVELGADALLSLVVSNGVGFPVARTATAVGPGLMASARLGWLFDPFLLWFQLAGVGWLQADHVQVFSGPVPASSASIPQLEVLAIVGFSAFTAL